MSTRRALYPSCTNPATIQAAVKMTGASAPHAASRRAPAGVTYGW